MTAAKAKAQPRRRNRRGSGEQLRGDIVTATKQLLAELASSDAVSIRAVADRVGVTPPSIYLHFEDKDALIEAVCADVFAELDAAMLTAADGADGPLETLCAYGLAYVEFAVAHPEHYRVATMERRSTKDASHLDMVLADSAFAHMNDAVAACMDAGVFAGGEPLPITMQLWAAAHGVAALMIAKPFLPWGDKREFTDRALRAAALGHAINDRQGGEVAAADVPSLLASIPRPR